MGKAKTVIGRVVVCLVTGFLIADSAAAADPAWLLSQIRSTTLDPSGAVSLRDVELELGPARFKIAHGILFPAKTTDGRTVETVFIGQARFLLDAPDEIEAGQLELFTGERSMDAPVETAVLVLLNETTLAELLSHPAPRDVRPELLDRAHEIHRRWLNDAERRGAGVEAAIFKSLVGDAAFRNYFALWCESYALGAFVYQLDPEDQEQITLASFQKLDMTNWERARLKHHIRVQQRKGRWLDVRVQDLGSWDVWLSTDWSPEGAPLSGIVGFEAEHYDLDVTIKRRSMTLDGRARMKLRVESSGRRVVRLELARDLQVQDVVDGEGRELFFFRSGDETVVLLPEPSVAGRSLALDVTYSGHALKWIKRKGYDLESTSNWYPHCGTVDRATYEVRLRWPRRLQLAASGRVVESGRGGGYRWERRRLDMPSIAFSFVLGDFVVDRATIGHVDLTVAFNRKVRAKITPELRRRTLDTVARALEYFEQIFGPYPLDELTVVTVPRSFSQSYLGFVTLADSLVEAADPLSDEASWRRDTTIAHEMAHQWWGNLVGWWSYRDQWLSEGMANYSALLFESRESEDSDRLAVMSAGWRKTLSRKTLDGRTIESLGPIVLGNRLNSSRARNGYRTIVYRKGAVVLAMLARAVGEPQFLQMLNSLLNVAANQVMTTEGFIKSMEKMSGLDLEGFAGQFVYGTGIPEVYYGYDLSPGEHGRWTLQGEARLLSAPRYRYEIVRTADGRWDLTRHSGPYPPRGPTTLMVPYRVTFSDSEVGEESRTERRKPRAHQNGQLFLHGRRDGFAIETEQQPIDLKLDPRGEILAWFYSEDLHPKRVLRYQAQDLAAEGRLEEAEARYFEALRSPADSGNIDPLAPAGGPRIQRRTEDLKIRLDLVRLYMEQGRAAIAMAALDEIDQEVEATDELLFKMQRQALRGRMEIRQRNYEAAFKRLKKTLSLASPRQDRAPVRKVLWRLRLSAERAAVTEAFSLLAIAAHETGKLDELRWALREARDRGVDVSLLEPADR